MRLSAKSVLVFGVYLIGMGTGFLFIPNILLQILGFPTTNEIWPRVVGLLALVLAFYYIQAARAQLNPFLQWTVYTRVTVFLCFTGFVLAGLTPPIMIMLGGADLAGALWTWLALRQETQGKVSGRRATTKQTAV